MDLIIKPDVLSSIVNGSQLQNFTEKGNFLPLKSMTVGFAAERNIMELRRKDVLSQDEVRRFMISISLQVNVICLSHNFQSC